MAVAGDEDAGLRILTIARIALYGNAGRRGAGQRRQLQHFCALAQSGERGAAGGIGEVACIRLPRHRQGRDQPRAGGERFLGHPLVAAFGECREHDQRQFGKIVPELRKNSATCRRIGPVWLAGILRWLVIPTTRGISGSGLVAFNDGLPPATLPTSWMNRGAEVTARLSLRGATLVIFDRRICGAPAS